jgi:exodeoxyribonuclease VII small subunit
MAEKQADKKLGFEKALARLEEIVAEMESGSLSLDKMMASFEEGTRLVKFCSAKLNEVEKKVEILTKKGDAETAEPFEAEEGEERPA